MKKIVIIGAGGFGREVQWLIERINQVTPTWQIKGYLDDNMAVGTEINGNNVLGGIDELKNYKEPIAVACAIGASKTRENIIKKIKDIQNVTFPNLVDPSVILSGFTSIGIGNIICAGNILTVNIIIQDFIIINLDCTIGHDAILKSFVTVYPSVNISGGVKIGKKTELGTGTHIIQGKTINPNIIIGAGSVVISDITEEGTYVGVPVKKIR